MSRKKTRTPGELLLHKLSERPAGTRCALVLDPDRIVELGRTLADDKGRAWEVVIHRGDDVVTRRAWQRVWGGGNPVLLFLGRAEKDDSALDASSIADLVSRTEGEAIDLSTVGYFHSLFPKVNPPPQALAEHRQAFLDNVEGIVKAYPRFKERWGEPDVWGRGQFLAILLMARFPEWTLDDLWCNEQNPIHLAAHAIALLCHPAVTPSDLRAVAEVIWESARHPRSCDVCRWLDVAPEDLDSFRSEIASYFVARDLLSHTGLSHIDALLKAKLAFGTFDAEEVGQHASAILVAMKDSGRWPQVHSRSQEHLTLGRMEKLADLWQENTEGLVATVSSQETAPVVLAFLIRQVLLHRFDGVAPGWPAWVEGLGQHPLLARFLLVEALGAQERSAAALMSAALHLDWVERILSAPVPTFASAEDLLDWYTANRRHLLEYRTADAFAKLELVDDSALHSSGYKFIMQPPEGLRYRVRRYLNQLDRQLAQFVRADPQKFLTGKRSAVRIIPDVVRGHGRSRNRRVWLLVMDGMRYDTWDAVLRPLLLQHFEVVDSQDCAFFSLLPSKTDIARRGLLAGAMGKDWKDHYNRPTKDERKLAARALGVAKQDLDSKVVFVGDAETTQARAKMGFSATEARDVNVFIYPISDDLGHHHNDTLAALNDKIRQQVVPQQGVRGIVDDLRRRVQAGDLVLVTSDHGFQELFPEECVSISLGKAMERGRGEEDVAYRHLKFTPGKDWSIGDHVVVQWEEYASDGKKQLTAFTLPVGGTWYQRERGKPARFAHGGISLAEMTIPCVLLQPIVEKAARVDYLDLPSEVSVEEDQSVSLEFELVNQGNVETAYELTVASNLGETLVERKGTLASGKREPVECALRGRYQTDLDRNVVPEGTLLAVSVQLAHTDVSGKMTRPSYGRATIRVVVKAKPTKIDTDALKAFDDL